MRSNKWTINEDCIILKYQDRYDFKVNDWVSLHLQDKNYLRTPKAVENRRTYLKALFKDTKTFKDKLLKLNEVHENGY